MKIVNFRGGLGNQMFIYAFCRHLQQSNPNERIFGSYWSGSLQEHSSFMIERIFGITLPPHNAITDTISKLCSLMENLRILPQEERKHSIFYNGFWLDKKYFSDIDLQKTFKFDDGMTRSVDPTICRHINTTESVSIHIRRGDYMTPQNFARFGAYCPPDYYKRAISMELEANSEAEFFVFSDDTEWARQNIPIENATFVSGNEGDNSWIDMYLMSMCKHNIIANSTFSWWAATLNANKAKRVYYPAKWFVWDNPDIFPDNWIPINVAPQGKTLQ